MGAVGRAGARDRRRAARALVVPPPSVSPAEARDLRAAREADPAREHQGAVAARAPPVRRGALRRNRLRRASRWGTEQTLERGSGVDMVLALDASLSMLATDARPNRLERMKEEARRLLALSTGDRVGLLAFAGRSYILTPLTVDRGALELFLDNLDPSVVGQAGSSLSRAIRQGTDLLVATQTTSDRALIIMSDGEAFEPAEEITAAAAHAAEAGVTVIAVGFGTEKGSTIPVHTAQGTQAKRDENGQIVTTRYSPDIAQGCGDRGARRVHRRRGDGQGRAHPGRALDAAQAGARHREPDRASRALSALSHPRATSRAARQRVEHAARAPQAHPAAATATALSLALLLVPLTLHAETGDVGDQLYQARRAIRKPRPRISARSRSTRTRRASSTTSARRSCRRGSSTMRDRGARARRHHRHLRRAPLQRALQPRPLLPAPGARCEVQRGDGGLRIVGRGVQARAAAAPGRDRGEVELRARVAGEIEVVGRRRESSSSSNSSNSSSNNNSQNPAASTSARPSSC